MLSGVGGAMLRRAHLGRRVEGEQEVAMTRCSDAQLKSRGWKSRLRRRFILRSTSSARYLLQEGLAAGNWGYHGATFSRKACARVCLFVFAWSCQRRRVMAANGGSAPNNREPYVGAVRDASHLSAPVAPSITSYHVCLRSFCLPHLLPHLTA